MGAFSFRESLWILAINSSLSCPFLNPAISPGKWNSLALLFYQAVPAQVLILVVLSLKLFQKRWLWLWSATGWVFWYSESSLPLSSTSYFLQSNMRDLHLLLTSPSHELWRKIWRRVKAAAMSPFWLGQSWRILLFSLEKLFWYRKTGLPTWKSKFPSWHHIQRAEIDFMFLKYTSCDGLSFLKVYINLDCSFGEPLEA